MSIASTGRSGWPGQCVTDETSTRYVCARVIRSSISSASTYSQSEISHHAGISVLVIVGNLSKPLAAAWMLSESYTFGQCDFKQPVGAFLVVFHKLDFSADVVFLCSGCLAVLVEYADLEAEHVALVQVLDFCSLAPTLRAAHLGEDRQSWHFRLILLVVVFVGIVIVIGILKFVVVVVVVVLRLAFFTFVFIFLIFAFAALLIFFFLIATISLGNVLRSVLRLFAVVAVPILILAVVVLRIVLIAS